jgi:hypothetical protein
MRIPTRIEREVGVVDLPTAEVEKSNRIRVQVLTELGGMVEEDINLYGHRGTIETLRSEECAG